MTLTLNCSGLQAQSAKQKPRCVIIYTLPTIDADVATRCSA
jgi:hypothetical protein